MKKIYVYTGKGAYQAKDIENCLSSFNLDYQRICEHELRFLVPEDILIMPGGQVNAYLPSLSEEGIRSIRQFVNDGGNYIGICAGAYIGGSSFKGKSGLKFINHEFQAKDSLEFITATDKDGNSLELILENGPDFSDINVDEVVLREKSGKPQAVRINYGKGNVFLFAAHPEGSVYYKKYPQEFSGAHYFVVLLHRL